MTRLALLGCGKIATSMHLPALSALQAQGLVDVSVFDADPTRAAAVGEQFGFAVIASWPDQSAGFDAAIVSVPPGPNAEVAITAVERGLHVLCEKPPGRTVEQAERMAAAAAAHPDRVTMVGFNRRFNPTVRAAMERSEALAAPTSFYGRFSRRSLGGEPSDTASDWITADSVHLLDLAIAVMGFPRAFAVSRQAVGGELDNVWTLQLHSERGAALLAFNYAAGGKVEHAEWTGPAYDVVIDLPDEGYWIEGNQRSRLEGGATSPEEQIGFSGEQRAFLDAISGVGPLPACDFAYAAEFMRLVTAILDAPNGALVPLERQGIAPVVHPPVVTSSRVERPVVVLHHSLDRQRGLFDADVLLELGRRCDIRTIATEAETSAMLRDANVLVTGRGTPDLPPGALDGADQLELLVVLGASMERYEPLKLVDRGVTVCNTADAVAVSVAEWCLMASLTGLRQLTRYDTAMHRGAWRPDGDGKAKGAKGSRPSGLQSLAGRVVPVPAKKWLYARSDVVRRNAASPGMRPRATVGLSDLHGVVVGLLGWGNIARQFARLLEPFGCTVLVWSEFATADELAEAGVRPASMAEILGAARVISVHRGLTDHSRGFLGAAQLALVRPGSVLVNSARGALIDEDALVARLRQGDIVAALDVYEEEPLAPEHPLRELENVVLTPHVASSTAQEGRRMGEQALHIVAAWVDGEAVPGLDERRLNAMS